MAKKTEKDKSTSKMSTSKTDNTADSKSSKMNMDEKSNSKVKSKSNDKDAEKNVNTKSDSKSRVGKGRSATAKASNLTKSNSTKKTNPPVENKKSSSKESAVDKSKKAQTKSSSGKGDAKSLQNLYEDGLKDIYWAEKSLKKALPKMKNNAYSKNLKQGIENHYAETLEQITRLEECFAEIGVKPEAEKCDAMAGLIEEAEGLMSDAEAGPVRDAAIIAAAQKVEHYEIATYGTLAAFAKVLGHKKGLKKLLKTLDEEKQCDLDLSKMADTNLNSKAI